MLCKSPFMIGNLPCACNRCMPCRISKKRLWTFRLELESKKHKHNSVATLTYNDQNLPEGGNLDKTSIQNWLKSLRKVLEPQKIRYFLVGEYGTNNHRPHYHVLLFGLNHNVAGGIDGQGGLVNATWKKGHTFVDNCSSEAIAYVAGYVTKKLQKDERESMGLTPEFTRMSLRPGIGAGAVKDIARVLLTDAGLESINTSGDVPFALNYGSKTVPLGRYLRGKLRKELSFGVSDGNTNKAPIEKTKQYWQEMYQLRRKAETDKSRTAKTFKQYLVDMNKQKILNLEAKALIYKDKGTL